MAIFENMNQTFNARFSEKLNIGGSGNVPDAVLYNPQTLTDEQKEQARENIGAASEEKIESVVKNYLEENPIETGATEEEAAQIEKNKNDIGGLSELAEKNESDIAELSEQMDDFTSGGYNVQPNKFLNPNGTFTNNNSFSVTDFLPVDGVSRISFPQFYLSGNATSCFFDSTKTVIGEIPKVANEGDINTVDVPENAKYVVITIRNTNITDFFIRVGNLLGSFDKTVNLARNPIVEELLDLTALNNTVGYLLKTDGTVFYNSTGRITPYMPIKNFEVIAFNQYNGANSDIGLCWYDENKKYIGSHINEKGWGGRETPTIPKNACYYRLPFPNDRVATVNLVVGYKTSKVAVGNIEFAEPIFDFSHLKIHNKVLFIGDSLTEGFRTGTVKLKDKSYPSYSAKLGDWTVVNEGVSGISSLGWWNAKKDTIQSDDFDGCFIYLGTNEGFTDTVDVDTSSGNYESYADTNTGRYCSIIEMFKAIHPNAKVYLISTTNQSSTTWDVVKKIAQKYDLPLFFVNDDRLHDLSLQKYHMSATDMTHYNTVGYWALSRVIMTQCEEYIREHIDEYTEI